MLKLNDPVDRTRAKASFDHVFQSADPFDAPFREGVEERLILYPVEYQLEQAEYFAISAAARAVGESEAYISLVEGARDGDFDNREHWQLSLDVYPYVSLAESGFFPLMEVALYSTHGTWGLLVSHEQHAVVGGPKPFMAALRRQLPSASTQVVAFLTYWKRTREARASEVRWIQALLAHVYGERKAQLLLTASNFERRTEADDGGHHA